MLNPVWRHGVGSALSCLSKQSEAKSYTETGLLRRQEKGQPGAAHFRLSATEMRRRGRVVICFLPDL